MRKLLPLCVLLCALLFTVPVSAGDPHTPGIEEPPPCPEDTICTAEGTNAAVSDDSLVTVIVDGVVLIFSLF